MENDEHKIVLPLIATPCVCECKHFMQCAMHITKWLETEKEMERDAKLRVESSEPFEKQFKVILCEIEED